jgi:hypothetical protein
MSKYLSGLMVLAALTGCSSGAPGGADEGEEAGATISGPFPRTIRGTIGYSYPLVEGGPIKFDLLEYRDATFIISAADYDSRSGIDEDDAEISVTIEPIAPEECGGEGQCFSAR